MTVVLANILQPIIDVFEQVLLFFHDTVGVGWGLSIIFLTLSVRLLLFPLTRKQFKGMQEMQKLAPEMKKLQAKYKDDKQRINQEMMKLYQEHKVNPFASCLPLVAQLPVFIALFYMLRADLKEDICGDVIPPGRDLVDVVCSDFTTGSDNPESFLFIPDLTDVPTGGVLVALIVMYVGSQLLSSLLMSSSIQDPMQRKLMLALPFFFVIFIINFPAGLLVYWITTNLWTVGQQYLLRRSAGMPLPRFPWQAPVEPAVAGGAAVVAGAAGVTSGKTTKKEKAATDKAVTSLEKKPAKGGGNGSTKAPKAKATPPAAEGNGNGASADGTGNGNGARAGGAKPPPPPRKKKKRTGKRR